MEYQVLARKWRPRGFDEVAGQSHVTTPLRNAIRSERLPHAILLTGPRGVGKTTIARILARCLNCEKGPTEEPCGSCVFCTDISAGSSTDVQEVDAASRTSVDDVREIIESVRYAAAPGKHRIFVIDEVHMLSTAAFNALLKTLEEPPPRSLFIFATTNPEKIPFTVVSRCQRHDLRRLPTAEVATRLREIAGSEGVEISDASLAAIARSGEGSLRDSLTLLDQVISVEGTRVEDEHVAEILDLIDRQVLLSILEACVDGDPAAALAACGRAGEAGIDAKRLGGALLEALRDLVVLRIAPDTAGLVEASDADLAAMQAVAERTDETRLRRMFRALLKEQEDLAWAPEPFSVLEMAVIRLATMPAGDDVARLLARLDQLEKRLGPGGGGSGGGRPGGSPRPGSPPAKRPAPREPSSKAAPNSPRKDEADQSTDAPCPTPPAGTETQAPRPSSEGEAKRPPPHAAASALSARSEPQASEVQKTGPQAPRSDQAADVGEPRSNPSPSAEEPPLPEQAPPGAEAGPPPSLDQVFDRLCNFAQNENRGLFAPLHGGRLVSRSEARLRIALPDGIAGRRLRSRIADLESVCARFFGRATRVDLEIENADASGQDASGKRGAELSRRVRNDALTHEGINIALDILDGEIVEIRPLGGDG